MDSSNGRMYGTLGELDTSADRVQCHICGRLYVALGKHLALTHETTADEYRAEFKLLPWQRLVPDWWHERESKRCSNRNYTAHLRGKRGRADYEAKKERWRQAKQTHPEFNTEWRRKISEARGAPVEFKCPYCGESVMEYPSRLRPRKASGGRLAQRKSCGKSECRAKSDSAALKGIAKSDSHRQSLRESAMRREQAKREARQALGPIPVGYCQCGCGEKAPINRKTKNRDGVIKGQPARFIAGHQTRAVPVKETVKEKPTPPIPGQEA